MVGRRDRTKARELVSRDKDSLISEEERQTKQMMQGQSLATSHKLSGDQPASEQMVAFPQAPSSVLLLRTMLNGVGYPSGLLEPALQLVSAPCLMHISKPWKWLEGQSRMKKVKPCHSASAVSNSQNTSTSSKQFVTYPKQRCLSFYAEN